MPPLKVNLEIERKFIVKSLPSIDPDEILEIDQYYWKNGSGIWERARTYHSNVTGDYYMHTIKRPISRGVCEEIEHQLTKEEFDEFKVVALSEGEEARFIRKERWVYKDGILKWEIDKFKSGYNLIIAEVEIPKKSYRIKFPQFIKDIKLLEVTGLKQFSNRNLSLKIKHDKLRINDGSLAEVAQ
jgi:CYTH domain-containing protein